MIANRKIKMTTNKIKPLIFSILFPILVLFFIQVTYKYNCYSLIAYLFIAFLISYSFCPIVNFP